MKKASLVYNPENNGFAEIYEIEGSGQRFYPSRATKIPVLVRKAYDQEVKAAINRLGLSWETQEAYHLLAEVLRDKICQEPVNQLAWDECNHKGYLKYTPIPEEPKEGQNPYGPEDPNTIGYQ